MSRMFAVIAAGLVSAALALPAAARDAGFRGGHDFHGGHEFHHDRFGFRGGVFLADPLYAYPYGLAGVYSYPYPYAPAGYGYFCPAANAFYPAVASCPVAWQLLPAQ